MHQETNTRSDATGKKLLHYYASKFNAVVFEIISRSQLLNITILYLHEQFNKIARVIGSVRESFQARMQIFLDVFRRSRSYIEEVDDHFSRIDETFGNSYSLGKSLQEMAADAEKRLKEIEDLSEVTDILAMNASIQAARVGKEGAGFAVVAKEIRQHGTKSREIVSEASDQLREMIGLIFHLVSLMETIADEVSSGRDVLKRLLETTEKSRKSADEVQEDVQAILTVFQEYDSLKVSLDRMIEQSSVSNTEIEEILLAFQKDLTRMNRLVG